MANIITKTAKRGRIDYEVQNFCANCHIKYDKTVRRCLECSQLLRTKRRNF